MIILDRLTKKLQIKLSATPTSEFVWTVSYVDDSQSGESSGTTSGSTLVTICTGIQGDPTLFTYGTRRIERISVYNADVALQTVTISLYNGTDSRTIIAIDLHPGYTIHYDNEWYVLNTEGARVNIEMSLNAISIGDDVIGATPGYYLYIDGSGNLANAALPVDSLSAVLAQGNNTGGNDIVLTIGDLIKSPVTDKSQIDFGSTGDEFNWYSDGSNASESYIQGSPTYVKMGTVDGTLNITPSFSILYGSLIAKIDGADVDIAETANTLELGNLTCVTTLYNTINLPQRTASELLATDGSKNLVSLPVSTYPSLTELSYVKGLSSAVQTQLDNKQPLDSDLTSWAAISRASGFDTLAAIPSSANLATLITDEVGYSSGAKLVFNISPDIVGTSTNDSAAAGSIGEVITSTRLFSSALALTTATPADVISITLTAGDWDLSGAVGFVAGVNTNVAAYVYCISRASVTLPSIDTSAVATDGEIRHRRQYGIVFTNSTSTESISQYPVSLPSTTTLYMVVQASFTVSTLSAFASLTARRAR